MEQVVWRWRWIPTWRQANFSWFASWESNVAQPCMNFARNRRMSANMGRLQLKNPKKTSTSIKNDWRVPGLLLSMFGLDRLLPTNFTFFGEPKKQADPEVITRSQIFKLCITLPYLRPKDLVSGHTSRPQFLPGMSLYLIAWVIFLWSWPVRPGPCDTHSVPGANVRRNVYRIPRAMTAPKFVKMAPQVTVEEVLLAC